MFREHEVLFALVALCVLIIQQTTAQFKLFIYLFQFRFDSVSLQIDLCGGHEKK